MKDTLVTLALGICAAIIVLILLQWFDPAQTQLRNAEAELARQQAIALAPLWLSVKRALVASLGVTGVSGALLALAVALVAIGSVPNGLRATWLRSWLVKPGRNGAMYPALAEPDGSGHIRIIPPVNEMGSQKVAALTTGLKPAVRLQGSAVRQILRQDDPQAMLEAPAPTNVGLDQVLAFDPQTSPHWLCVGDTGSGKSTAIYAIANQMRKQLGAEFVILEREAQDWNDQAAAVSVPGYLEALERVEEERLRRAALLREADVDHISKLTKPPAYLCVILEEAESVYQAMRLIGSAQGTRYKAIVRDIASMGRKQGILLVVATQTGTSEVFDVPTRKNLGHKLFFRNEPAVGDSWGIPREVGISKLPTGTAYSLNHSALVEFPRQGRPRLPLSRLYREVRPEETIDGTSLRLPADAESDGLGENDTPSTQEEFQVPGTSEVPGTYGAYDNQQRLQPEAGGVTTGYETRYEAVATVAATVAGLQLPKRQPTPVEAAAMRAHYARTGSKTAVCRKFYGYKDGDTWDWVKLALAGRI